MNFYGEFQFIGLIDVDLIFFGRLFDYDYVEYEFVILFDYVCVNF